MGHDLTPVAGLVLVGHLLQAMRPVLVSIDAALPIKAGAANSDIVRSYLGPLTQGRSDFDAVENSCDDAFFKQALAIGMLPSSPTLRQRMHNSGTAKDGVRCNRTGVDGYCPLADEPGRRRRLSALIQALICRAGRLISTGRKLILGLRATTDRPRPSHGCTASCSRPAPTGQNLAPKPGDHSPTHGYRFSMRHMRVAAWAAGRNAPRKTHQRALSSRNPPRSASGVVDRCVPPMLAAAAPGRRAEARTNSAGKR